MKKLFGVFILGVLMFSMMGSLVSAGAVEDIQEGVASGYRIIEPALRYVVGDTELSTEFFFAKVLLLIIVFAIIWVALSKIPFFSDQTWVLWIVTVGVSILAIRWFGNASIVRSVILPYSALGITLSAGFPFVLYFLIVKDFHQTIRKISWIFFIVVFIGLWIMRSGEGAAEAVGGPVGNFAYIYLVTAGVALLVLIFDGTIQKIMTKAKIERIQSAHTSSMVGDLRDEMKKLTKRYRDEKEGYDSIYTSFKGHKGWEEDMEKIKKSIATLKSSH